MAVIGKEEDCQALSLFRRMSGKSLQRERGGESGHCLLFRKKKGDVRLWAKA